MRRRAASSLCSRCVTVAATIFVALPARVDASETEPSDVPPDPPSAETVEVFIKGDAVRPPVAPKDPSVAGAIVRREALSAPGLRASDVLRAQAGVQVVESGGIGAPATASVRGATAADTPVYLGGVRLNDDVGGTADLSLIPLWLIDHVEIYRGNAPIEADRLGPGGAIFFEPRLPSRTTAGAGGMLGSFGARRGWGFIGIKSGGVSSLFGLSADAVDNDYQYRNDHGTLLAPTGETVERRANADTHIFDGWALGRVDFGNGARIDVVANGITREQGVPGLALLPARMARSRTDRALASVVASVPFGSSGQHNLEAKTSALLSRSQYHDPLYELALQTTDLEVTAQRVEQSLATTLALSRSWVMRLAISAAHEKIERSPNDIPLGRSHRFFARSAAALEFRASENLTLRGLGAVECHETGRDDSRTCDVLAPSGRIGAELAWRHITLLTNFGRYARVPTLGEIYGVSGVVRGNPALVPERGLTAELGLRSQSGTHGGLRGAFADVFVFVRSASDLIAYARTGQGYVIPYNVGGARVLGAEVLTGAALFSFLHAEVAATFQDPRDTSSDRTTINDVLPFRSRLVVSPRITASHAFEESTFVQRVSGSLSYTYQSSRYADPAGLVVIPDQGSLDASVEASWFRGHFTARARVTDVLDSVRTDVIGYPLPGRGIFFSAEATW